MIINCHSFHEERYWWFRSIIIVRSIEDQFIPRSFAPGIVFMIFHEMNMIMNSQLYHEQPYWWFRSIIIIGRIENQFIPHSFEPEIVFMMLNDLSICVSCHSFHNQRYWWFRSIIIVRRIEDQFINHWIEAVFFMILNEINMIFNLSFVQWTTILVNQEHHHCQKHWRSIHPSLI